MATRIPINKEVNNFDGRQRRVWADMEQDMDRRRREWEGEIEKMRSDFFQLRPDKPGANFDNLDGPAATLSPRMAAPVRVIESDDGKAMMEKDEFGNPVFRVRFNMKEYRPEEVNVKMDSNKIMVSAKHEEKGEGSSVSREYSREVNIPAEVDPLSLQCIFQPDGYLVFNAPLPVPKYNAIKDSNTPTHNSPNIIKTSSSFQSSSSKQHGNGGHVTTVPVNSHRESPIHHQPVQMQHQVKSHSQPIHQVHQQHNLAPNPQFSKSTSSPYSSTSTLNTTDATEHPDHVVPAFKPPPDLTKLDQLLETSQPPPPLTSHLLHTSASPSHLLNSSPLHKPPPFSTLSSTFPAGPIFTESSHQAQLANPVVTSQDGKFQLTMPIDDFKPEELTVKTQDRKVIICAKRQMSSGHRNHTMEMNREHSLPDNVDPLTVKAFFTDTNNLIVEAPFLH